MFWNQFFARKSLKTLHDEMDSDNRLRRVLGPVSLTSLGVGAIIGAGIFALTGRTAAVDAGPAILISFVIAGIGCTLAALCYAEFAALAPVAGSAYTYAYATLGELAAWIIGWDLILEYAMSCAVVASHWTGYLNELLRTLFGWQLSPQLLSDPFTPIIIDGQVFQAWCNLPAVIILLICTGILVVGIKPSATTNAILVAVKLSVVLVVILVGVAYVKSSNWTSVPVVERNYTDTGDFIERHPNIARRLPANERGKHISGADLMQRYPQIATHLSNSDRQILEGLSSEQQKWGLGTVIGLKYALAPLDAAVRSPFAPYGFSGIMLGAAIIFFAYIGFDSISTHSEEAKRPQRDVPIGILASLAICTVLYILVAAVLTGMETYPTIGTAGGVAAMFRKRAAVEESAVLRWTAALIAIGALAGMTSMLLVTFLSQARIFLAMARDGLLPKSIFGAVHPRFRTPHISTMLTGGVICIVAAVTPIRDLEAMVNIGTLMAFVVVCASVMLLRIRHPDAPRPFRCPALFVVAPLGIVFNLGLTLFLPLGTWWRLGIWLALGLCTYFTYGMRHSNLRKMVQ